MRIIIDTQDIECTLSHELRSNFGAAADSNRLIRDVSEAVIVCGDELTQLEIGAFERIQAVLNRWNIIVDLTTRNPRHQLIKQLVEAAFNSSSVFDSNGDSAGVQIPK